MDREEFKNEIKENLTIDQIADIVAEMGGEPQIKGDYLVAATICHNHPGEGSHKLYYYDNTHLFKCYTECNESFDIFSLVIKYKKNIGEKGWELPQAIIYVANFFNIPILTENFSQVFGELEDWEIFNRYEKISEQENEKIVEMKVYDDSFLKYFPKPHILPWEKEGISYDIMIDKGVCFNPLSHGIIIPHYDINNNLVGVRERTLVKENEQCGKYRPAIIGRKMYNHPLGINLYNLNKSKDNIKRIKKAIVFEGEKGPITYASYFGAENDICVACCGSSLISYQVDLLLSLNVDEIVIAFDKQFQKSGDKEFQRWTRKLTDIHTKYSNKVHISFIFDKWNILDYKDSPIDKGKENFIFLFNNRITL